MKTPAVMLLLSVCALAACPPGNGDPDAGQSLEPKLSVIIADVFQPRCGATACHGGPGPAAFLNLEQNVHARLQTWVGSMFTNKGAWRPNTRLWITPTAARTVLTPES